MANVGDIMSSASDGWTRFDNTSPLIEYSGEKFTHLTNHATSYNKTVSYIPAGVATAAEILSHRISFSFVGTSIRLIGTMDASYTKQFCVSVDGIDTVTNVSIKSASTALLSEIVGLNNTVHNVEIKCLDGIRYSFDCVDVVGYLCERTQEIPNISHKNATLTYTLPMNTTDKILAKTNDQRLGLLGMANDGTNFGDLYVVGRDGKAHLTKGATKSEVIFEGIANNGSYELSKNINLFSYLIILAKIDHKTPGYNDATSDIVHKSDFANMLLRCVAAYWNSSTYYAVEYSLSDNQLKIGGISKGSTTYWLNPHIYKVVGVY